MNRYLIFLCILVMLGTAYTAKGQKYKEMAGHTTKVILDGVSGTKRMTFEINTKMFLDAINSAYRTNKQPKIPATIADEKINETIGNLWAVSPFFSVNPEVIEHLISGGQGNYEIRNLQIVFEEAQKGYEQQDAVLLLDANGKIVDFKIALGYHSISNILRDNVSVTDLRRRQIIISFVENFRTAYNVKDTSFLKSVFSDKALIITGKVLQKTVDGELQPVTEYKRQTKVEYLTNLALIFSRAKMISINFDSITVVQHPAIPDLYGVTLTQSWNSESLVGGSYKDIGYVFLIIDFTKEAIPKIWVRTWQDKKFVDNDHGVFSFNHFNIK